METKIVRTSPGNSSFTSASITRRESKSQQVQVSSGRSIEDFIGTAMKASENHLSSNEFVRTISQRLKNHVKSSLSEPLNATECRNNCGCCQTCRNGKQQKLFVRNNFSNSLINRRQKGMLVQRTASVRRCVTALSNISSKIQLPKFILEQTNGCKSSYNGAAYQLKNLKTYLSFLAFHISHQFYN